MDTRHPVSITALRTLPIFSGLDVPQLEAIARFAWICHAERKTTLVSAGQDIEHVYLILAGRVRMELCNAKGRSVILHLLGQGEMFGEVELIDDGPGSVTVTTVMPCEMVVIGKDDFRRCMAESFDISRFIMHNLVRRMRQADSKIASLVGLDVHDRVALLLQDLSEVHHGRRAVSRRISRSDIARMVGASREMVSRVMRDLHIRGAISESGGVIWLHDGIAADAAA